MPGDLLYSVKVNFNEELKGFLTFSEEKKIAWEEERVERRLQEAQTLVMAGVISPRAVEQITENFDRQAGQVLSRMKKFEEDNMLAVIEMSSRFESTLSTHEEILDKLVVLNKDANLEKAENITMRVRVKAEDASRVKENAQNSLSVAFFPDRGSEGFIGLGAEEEGERLSPHTMDTLAIDEDIRSRRKEAAEVMRRSAERKIGEFESMVQRFKEEKLIVRESKIEDIENKINESKAMFKAGEDFFAGENYGEAFLKFRDSFSSTNRLSLLLRAEMTLKVELNGLDKEKSDILDSDILPIEDVFIEIDPDDKEGSVEKIREAVNEKLEKTEEVFAE
jgi:hypothetical protein